MAVEQRNVAVAKEASEVMDLVVGVVGHFKQGKGVAQAAELLDELMAALSGLDQLDDEWKEDRVAVLNAVLLGSSELVNAMLTKEVEA